VQRDVIGCAHKSYVHTYAVMYFTRLRNLGLKASQDSVLESSVLGLGLSLIFVLVNMLFTLCPGNM